MDSINLDCWWDKRLSSGVLGQDCRAPALTGLLVFFGGPPPGASESPALMCEAASRKGGTR